MKSLLRVSAVSYLNTKPLLWGLNRHPVATEITITENYPALIARDLLEGNTDLALVPVALLAQFPNAFIVGNHCIAATGAVASVCIFSEVPIEEVQSIYLDYQSRTSVQLAQLLLRNYWKKEVQPLPAAPDYQSKIRGTTAGVIIGDRALEARKNFPHCYDLATAWIDWQGLPFVFAAWVSAQSLSEGFTEAFDEAQQMGLAHLGEVIAENPYPHYDLMTYYTQNIHYRLGPKEKEGLHLFLKLIREAGMKF